MINELLKKKKWNSQVIHDFLNFLKGCSNEEKCEIVVSVTKELMKRGDELSITAAEVILVYATQHYLAVSDSNYKAIVYYQLGRLYENHIGNFIKAYTYYEKYTLNNTINGNDHSILLRALILRDDFTYSDELETEFRMSLAEADLGLRNDRLYEHLGSFIIANHEGDENRAKDCKKHLKNIVKGDEFFFLDLALRKDTVPDTLNVPQKVIAYIKEL